MLKLFLSSQSDAKFGYFSQKLVIFVSYLLPLPILLSLIESKKFILPIGIIDCSQLASSMRVIVSENNYSLPKMIVVNSDNKTLLFSDDGRKLLQMA